MGSYGAYSCTLADPPGEMLEGANFGVVDYVMMGLTVAVSLAIGGYHGFRGNKTADDYAMGGRKMQPLPVSLSLLATFLSANGILGYSGEMYGHGLGQAWVVPGLIFAITFAAEVVLPVLYPLRLTSPNEYLELRFHSGWLRRLSMAMSFISIIMIMGLSLYAPTLALTAVTPLDYSTYIWIIGIVVTIYASIGGLKAVVWTDAFQMVMMVGGVLLVTVMACIDAGGLSSAWRIATEGGRTQPNFDASLHTRHTVWNVIIMTMFYWGSHYSVSQANYQRISAVPTISQAKRVLYYNIVGNTIFLTLVFLMGLFIYAVYAGCDPYERGLIFSKDQIAAHYVSDRLSHLTGVPGIFVATLLSAALSTVSSGVNTLATLLWADLFSQMPCFKDASDFVATTTSKITTLCLGSMIIGLAFLASKMGGLMQAGYTVVGVMAGPVLGVYLLGMAVPFCNKLGAFAGILGGWGLCVWIAVGGFIYKGPPELLPFSAANCSEIILSGNLSSVVVRAATTIRTTTIAAVTASSSGLASLACQGDGTSGLGGCVTEVPTSGLVSLYTISYTHFPVIGLATCLAVGILVSLVSGPQNPKKVPRELVLVCLRRFVSKQRDAEFGDRVTGKPGSGETVLMDTLTGEVRTLHI